jgi:hypothetical protein
MSAVDGVPMETQTWGQVESNNHPHLVDSKDQRIAELEASLLAESLKVDAVAMLNSANARIAKVEMRNKELEAENKSLTVKIEKLLNIVNICDNVPHHPDYDDCHAIIKTGLDELQANGLGE